MSILSTLIKSGAWLSLANIISKVTNALTLPLLARLLSPESLGIYNIVISLAQTVQNFSGLGIEIAIQRNGAQHKTVGVKAIGRLFGVGFIVIFATNLVMGLGVWHFRQVLADKWLTETIVVPWLGVAALLISLQPLGNVPLLFLIGLQDFRAYAIRSSLGLIIGNIATVFLTWKFGLKGAMEGLIVSVIIQIIWSYLIVKPVLIHNNIKLQFDHFWQELYSILKFGFPYFLGTNLLYSLMNLPLMGLVSHYSGLESLGYLRAAQSMGSLVGFIPLATAPAVISHLSASSADKGEYGYLKSVHLRIVWMILLISTTIICLFLPNLMTWLFGNNYRPAIILAWLFVWASVLTGISSVLIQYLVADGKTAIVCWGSAFSAIFWYFPGIMLIPKYGALGFLMSYLISSLIEVIVMIYPAIISFDSQDLLLVRNLTFLSILLFSWISILSFFNFINPLTYLASFVILIASILFAFAYILHVHEQLKTKQLLRLIKKRIRRYFSFYIK